MWEGSKLTRFVSFHSLPPSLLLNHTHTSTEITLTSFNKINGKKSTRKDTGLNMVIYMHYTLFSLSLLVIPAFLAAFLHQTRSASNFLHHSDDFCLTLPLSNSVTSPYVSHLTLHLPLRSCQMPMIHIRSVYASCCSSLSSHPHTLTSSSRPLPLFQLLLQSFSPSLLFLPLPSSSSSSPTVILPPSVPLR